MLSDNVKAIVIYVLVMTMVISIVAAIAEIILL
jgi:hypothetical protein